MKTQKVDPQQGESEDEFMSRCMSKLEGEFPDEDQRVAVCLNSFRDKAVKASHPQCPSGQRYDGGLGRCVAKELLADHSPEKSLQALRNDIQRMRDMKNRIRQEPNVGLSSLGNRQVDDRQDPDPFLAFELLMAQDLAERAFEVADEEILPIYDDEVLPEDPAFFNEAKLEEANEEASTVWRDIIITTGLAASVAALLQRSLTAGEATVAPGILQGVPSVEEVLAQMRNTITWNTNQFFTQQVVPSIERSVRNMFDNTSALGQPNLDTVRKVIDRRLKSVPYWRVVANANASRAYHYGMLKAAQFQGFTGYEFVAVLDSRTSDICRELDGQTWFIADAVNRMEMVAGSDDPDAAKTFMPWVNVEAVQGQSADALRDMGVMVPPLHGNCRSTLRPIF